MSAFLQLFVLALALSQVLGSTEIIFNAYPTSIAPPITFISSLSCQLRDNSARQPKRSITETNDEIVRIKSIIVTRNGGDKVAHISESTGEAEAQADDYNIVVNGAITKIGTLLGYLSVSWNVPVKEQAGTFSCEIVAENDDGKELTFLKTAGIGFKEPELEEIIEEVVSNHQQIKRRPVPRESVGNGTCGSSKNWVGANIEGLNNARSTKVTIRFDQKTFFLEAPLVQVGLRSIEALSPVRYSLRVSKVERFEFEVECITWGGSTVNDMEFNWLALTSPKPREL